ncbi:MAG: hypothetical protein GX616_23015 [Planctomycetes bacterium]|nr:hypothetical protein [Planctomycetota bacterium]
MNDVQTRALLEKLNSLHATLSQVYGMVNTARPLASDVCFQCMQSAALAEKDVTPGRTFAQVGEEFADAVESVANSMAKASGNLAILIGTLSGGQS